MEAQDLMIGMALNRQNLLWTSPVRAICLIALAVSCSCLDSVASAETKGRSAFASSVFRKSKVQKRKFSRDDLLSLLKTDSSLQLPVDTQTLVSLLMDYAEGAKKPAGPFCTVRETDVQLPKAEMGYFVVSVPPDFLSSSSRIFARTKDRLAVLDDDIDPMATKQVRTNFFPVQEGSDCSSATMFARIEIASIGPTDDTEQTRQADLALFENGQFTGWYSLLLRAQEEVSLEIEIPEYTNDQQLRALKEWLVECYPGYSCEMQHYVNSAL